MEDTFEQKNLYLDKLSSFNSKPIENASPKIETTLFPRSRNNSNEKSTIKQAQNKIDNDGNRSPSADIGMIVETEEGQHQPDLSEIIRSLDTPPPS